MTVSANASEGVPIAALTAAFGLWFTWGNIAAVVGLVAPIGGVFYSVSRRAARRRMAIPALLATGCCAVLSAEPPSGSIVFSSPALGQYALLDTRNGNVTPINAKGSSAALSPNGRRLAYLDDRNRLQVLDLASGTGFALGDGVNDQYSPTFVGNDTIAYIRKTPRGMDICLTPVAKFQERIWNGKIQFDLLSFMQIAWVPGTSEQAPSFILSGNKGLWLLSPAGSKSLVAERAGETCHYQAVSPDGKRLLYVLDTGNEDIYVVDLGGGNPVRLTQNHASSWPTWSPDGRQIAFLTTGTVSNGLEIRSAHQGRTVGRTSGQFLNAIVVMGSDGSGAAALLGRDGKPVLAARSNISWR